MSKFDSPLDDIKMASPCPADWNEMYGDNRKRFCGDCRLNVYNLSEMTRGEAEALVMNAEGRLCVRFYKRSDGTVITQDCPVGWAKVKQRTRLYAAALASLIMALFTGLLFVSLFSRQRPTIGKFLKPFAIPTPRYEPLMGNIAIPPKNTSKNTNTSIQGVLENRQSQDFEMGKMKVIGQHERGQ